jgi:hypothetical protein
MEYINYKKIKVYIIFFLIVFQLSFLYATDQDPPALPDNIYGQIFIDDSPADVNAKIVAKINDDLVKTYYTTQQGLFGSSNDPNKYFLVSAFTSDIGEEISFYYEYDDFLQFLATTDPEIVYYNSGVLKEVNLYFYTESTDSGQEHGSESNGDNPNGNGSNENNDTTNDDDPEDEGDYTVEDVYDDIGGFVPLSAPNINDSDVNGDDDDDDDDDEDDAVIPPPQPIIQPVVPDTNQVPDNNQSQGDTQDLKLTQDINQEPTEETDDSKIIHSPSTKYLRLGIIFIIVFLIIFMIGLLIFKINKKKKEKYVQTKLF